jgi:hypothetical protein
LDLAFVVAGVVAGGAPNAYPKALMDAIGGGGGGGGGECSFALQV